MDLTRISRYLSLILRHKPWVAGVTLDRHGWADVEELLAGVSRKYPINKEILEEVVRTDNKQRYSFNDEKTKIRANQGHSIPVDVELPVVTNVSKLAFIKNMKRLLHEIMQWSLFSYIKIPPRLRFLGFRCGKAASAS